MTGTVNLSRLAVPARMHPSPGPLSLGPSCRSGPPAPSCHGAPAAGRASPASPRFRGSESPRHVRVGFTGLRTAAGGEEGREGGKRGPDYEGGEGGEGGEGERAGLMEGGREGGKEGWRGGGGGN